MNFAPRAITRFLGQTSANSRYAHLLAQVPTAVFFVAPRTGLIYEVNGQAVALVGYTEEQLLALSMAELIDHSQPEGALALASLRELINEEPIIFENVPLNGANGRCYVDLTIALAGVEGKESVALLQAVSTEARLEHEHRQAEHQQALHNLAALAALLSDAQPIDQVKSHLTEGVALIARALQAQVVGLYQIQVSPKQTLALTVTSLGSKGWFPDELDSVEILNQPNYWDLTSHSHNVPPSLKGLAEKSKWAVLQTMPLTTGSGLFGLLVVGYNHYVPEASELILQLAGQMLAGLWSASLLVQSMHNSRAQADHLTEQFNAILGALHEAVLVVDKRGVIMRINAEAERLLGYDKDEANGQTLSNLLVSPTLTADSLLQTTANGDTVEQENLTLYHRDGSPRSVWLWASPLLDQMLGSLLVIVDRTEAQNMEVERNQLQQRAYLGELSAAFAHEVRNPLNGIATSAQVLAMQLPQDSALRSHIDDIEQEVERIDRLVRDVLPFARGTHRQLTPVYLGALLEQIVGRWQARMTRNQVAAACHIMAGTPPAMIDLRQMEQVFTNLITNAIDALAEVKGGEIHIKVQTETNSRGQWVAVSVADTGPGIPADQLEDVLKPFMTSKKQGNGLGLAISQQIITAHQGSIKVESWPGAGTVFTVLLPAATEGTQ